MKKNETLQHMSQDELEEWIERYFDCALTDEQEQQLKRELAVTTCHSEAIDEARFTMGFMSVGMRLHNDWCRSAGRRNRTWRMVLAAASVVLILTIGLGLLHMKMTSSKVCYAYVEGGKVNNESEIMAMIQNDLGEVNDASESMNDRVLSQLTEMGDALEIE